jgi:predicted RecB family nuclease
MQLLDGELVLSPTDLTGFVACSHLTQLELAVSRGELERPRREDPFLDVLTRRGDEHETTHVGGLRAAGHSVVEITIGSSNRAELLAAEAATLEAMRSGTEFIYQATFFDGRWRGHADFLERVDTPGPLLGDWSYEIADTKLARRVKAAAVLQMAAYAEQLERLQGLAPALLHMLGGDGVRHSFPTADVAAYHRTVKARFEAVVLGVPAVTYPEPVSHCSLCRWDEACSARRRGDDYLSLVAGMRGDQSRKLIAASIPTRSALAVMASGTRVEGIGDATLERLARQADLQVRGQHDGQLLHAVLAPELPDDVDLPWPKRGFAALPAPSPGDLFFDMEGDPYALDGGLEYLFGVVEIVDGVRRYTPFWAHSRAEEGSAFGELIDFVMTRLERDPCMHVYHYAAYELSALKRLMGAHGTREREVDILLRGGVLVDLYTVVRGGVQLSTESYSLKEVEKLYLTRPAGEVMNAGASIVAYEDWLAHLDPGTLTDIAVYNEADCASLIGLQEWLEARRAEAEAVYGPIPRPVPADGQPSEALDEREQRVADLAARLTANADTDQVLLANLLAFHRREAKPEYWSFYQRRDAYDADDFVEDRECLGGLRLIGEVDRIRQSTVYRYEFEPQDHKFDVGAQPYNPGTRTGAGTVTYLDDTLGIIELSRATRRAGEPHPRNLMPSGPIGTEVLEDAIFRVGEWVADHGLETAGRYQAIRDLLARRPPRRVGNLDQSYLAIQGPPGSGKTTEGARLIMNLVRDGRQVGVTGPSHAVIGNLLKAVAIEAAKRSQPVRLFQRCDVDEVCSAAGVTRLKNTDHAAGVLRDETADVVGGTAWLWASPDLADAVRVLVVDEAGQVPLANILAVGGAASGIVLLGDPQQLAQPSKGTHPAGAARSALAHLLGDEHRTMPEVLGQFLATTHRMPPDVCSFISEVIYEGRLHPEPELDQVTIDGLGTGVRFVPVTHLGNRVASTEEAHQVRAVMDHLLGRDWTNEVGETSTLEVDDVLVVAPYNAHVARLRQHLPDGVRVGTVDKFQGQQAPVVIYSMATSTPEDAPRGMDFLYDLHRLNVAISRAQALAYLVCSPKLLDVLCSHATEIPLANALCRYVEVAGEQSNPSLAGTQ